MKAMHEHHYRHLSIMAGLSFIAMYVLMYAMANALDDVYMNVNQIYMAGLMVSPMVVIELVVMRSMYQNEKRNLIIIAASLVVGLVMFLAIRQQTAVGDR